MRRTLLPSLAAVLLAALSAPLCGCACGVEAAPRAAYSGAVLPSGQRSLQSSAGVNVGFQGGVAADGGPGARPCEGGKCAPRVEAK